MSSMQSERVLINLMESSEHSEFIKGSSFGNEKVTPVPKDVSLDQSQVSRKAKTSNKYTTGNHRELFKQDGPRSVKNSD